MCAHYYTNFWCGKCLDVVFQSRQKLNRHMKRCKGLIVGKEKRKPSPSHMKGASSTSLSSKKKKKHKSQKLQDNSQPDLQMHPQPSSQMSSHHSRSTMKKESTTTTLKRSHSGAPAARTRARIARVANIPVKRRVRRNTSLTSTRRNRCHAFHSRRHPCVTPTISSVLV